MAVVRRTGRDKEEKAGENNFEWFLKVKILKKEGIQWAFKCLEARTLCANGEC